MFKTSLICPKYPPLCGEHFGAFIKQSIGLQLGILNSSSTTRKRKHHYLLKHETNLTLNFITLFTTFLQAGGLTIGDGYAVIAPLRRALVKRNCWLSDDEFAQHLAVVQAMPGVFNINLATYIGRKLYGWKGSAACLLGMILPPLLIFLIFSIFYNDLCNQPAIKAFLRGARPAIVALIALPCLQMWNKSGISLSTVWIPVGAAIAIGLLGISPTYIILGLILLAALYAVFVLSSDDK